MVPPTEAPLPVQLHRQPVMKKPILKVIWSLLLAIALFFSGGDTFGAGDSITQLSQSYLYNIPRWEVGNFLKKWTSGLDRLLSSDVSQKTKVVNVQRYFDLSAQANDLKSRLSRANLGLGEQPGLDRQRAHLQAMLEEQDELEPQVEETLEAAISSVLKSAEVSSSVIGFNLLWPPVDFRLDEVPKVLVVSSRNRIVTLRTMLLVSDMTLAEREALEESIASRNLSALVVSVGGVATYPSLIREGQSLRATLRAAAHEWTHHYLAFHPLGRGYFSNSNMTTLNEAVADVVGNEIGDAVWTKYFASSEQIAEVKEAKIQPTSDATPLKREVKFDFGRFMRELRVRTDELLISGQVDEAEAYMETSRMHLMSQGILIRKINQAFFAFHGNYAVRPGSVSPIGDQVESVRKRVDDIGAFLSTMNRFSSYESFLRSEVG